MLRFSLLLVFCASTVMAQDKAGRAAAFFEGWIAEQDVPGAMVVLRGREVVASVEERRAVSEPMEMASLSKAITGVCAYTLTEDGTMVWDETPNMLLGRGPEVSLGALVTHSGGVWPDGTQNLAGVLRFYRGEDASGVEARIHDRPLQTPKFRYNNENYALVSLMIEAATGKPYEAVCRPRALAPAGVSAAGPSPITGATLAWGGWQMSLADYGAFHSFWFGEAGDIRAHVDRLPKTPHLKLFYGPGSFFAGPPDARVFWHFGGLCIPGSVNAGSFAVTFASGWTVVAGYDACLADEDASSLWLGLAEVFDE